MYILVLQWSLETLPPATPSQDATVFVSSADCRAIVFPNFEEAARVWIKATSSVPPKAISL